MLPRRLQIPVGWETVIGIETHVQLKTKQKLFSGEVYALHG